MNNLNSTAIKRILNISAAFLLFWASGINLSAQVVPVIASNVAFAKVTCVVINPIGIIKVRDMNFGNIISGQAGAVTLPPDGGRPITSGNVSLETSSSVITTATFEVSDSQGNSAKAFHYFTGYTITLPNYEVILANESGQTMRVADFTSIPSATAFGTFTNGQGSLSVGATLYVSEGQGLGQYASVTSFPVTVNYY